MTRKFLAGFSIFDLMIIAVLAALGVAIGGFIGYFVRLITGPLMLPGGAVAGGIYMLFLVLCVSLTGKKSAAFLCGLVQAIIVMISGIVGNHGAMTIITYTMPGVAIFLLFVLMRHKGCCKLCCFFGCMAANLTGTFLVGWGVMALPAVPMLLALAIAALSGGLGGLLTWSLAKQLKKLEVIK
ncbi:MAG: ECF transporter S component [Clostridiales bacterium]|nr:ECF transporter S component [Clostridiales bacterium]